MEVEDLDKLRTSELSRQAAIESFRHRPESETGWDRLRELYTIRHVAYAEFDLSPEMELAGDAFKVSSLIGFVAKGSSQWDVARDTFIRVNKAQKFLSQREFMRQAFHYQVLSCMRHGFRYGLKLGAFTGLYCLSTLSVSLYYNSLSSWNYATSGMIAGALWQGRFSPAGFVVGAASGGLLSLIAGSLITKIMEYNGEDLASMRYQLHFDRLELWEQRNKLKAEYLMKQMVEEAKKELEEQKAAQ